MKTRSRQGEVRTREVLYVMPEHPSVSETFVVNEVAELGRQGSAVICQPLRLGAAKSPAANVRLLAPPPTTRDLLKAVPRALFTTSYPSSVWRLRRASVREHTRLAVAHLHAAHCLKQMEPSACIAHVHAHFLGRPADVARIVARKLGTRWTVTAHGSDALSPTEPELFKDRLRDVAAVACANTRIKATLSQVTDVTKPPLLKVIHCGVDTRLLSLRSSRHDGPPTIITVARLVPTKGFNSIIPAAAALLTKHAELEWLVVGDGPMRPALLSDRRLDGVRERFRLLGAQSHDATLDLLLRSDVMALPCETNQAGQSDGIPVALMEAMAVGVPVVTCAVGGIRELVTDRLTGLLVGQKDSEGLTDVLEAVLFRRDALDVEVSALTERAREEITANFDLEGETRKVRGLFDSVSTEA